MLSGMDVPSRDLPTAFPVRPPSHSIVARATYAPPRNDLRTDAHHTVEVELLGLAGPFAHEVAVHCIAHLLQV